MLALGLDTATPAISAAVVEVTPDRVVRRAQRSTVDPRAHGELLAPQIAAVLADAGVRPVDLAAVVAGTGPGPYTGLRVGLATAATMAQALGVPSYGVCSLDGIGAAATGFGVTLVVTDARRREVYWAVYGPDGARIAGPAVERPVVVAAEAARLGVTVARGEGADRYAAELGVPVAGHGRHPSVYRLLELAADRIRSGAAGEVLVPRYLRRPDVAQPRPPKPAVPW